MMPMLEEGAPEFSKRFPEAARIFNNLHMRHDNIDDILSRPDLYPTLADKRRAILRIHQIYLHRNHEPEDRYAEYHAEPHPPDHMKKMMERMGPRPPSAREVFDGHIPVFSSQRPPPATTAPGVEAGVRYQFGTQVFFLDPGAGSEVVGPTRRSTFYFTAGVSCAF